MTKFKKSALALSAACVLSVAGGLAFMPRKTAEAAINGYYGKKLDGAAAAFYSAFQDSMDFTGGIQLSGMSSPAIKALASEYEAGDPAIMKAFYTAVDSFYYDNVDKFYVDFSNLDLRVTKGAKDYVIKVGPARSNSYLRNGLDYEGAQALVTEFNGGQDSLVDTFKGDIDFTGKTTVAETAEAICDKILTSVDYGYGDTTESAAFADTAYGALKHGAATSAGYARLFKAIMEKTGVVNPSECIIVPGYRVSEEGIVPWTWNYVQDKNNKWYAVDVAASAGAETKYVMMTGESFFLDHYEESKVSAFGAGLEFPELVSNDFSVAVATKQLHISGDATSLTVDYGGKSEQMLGEDMFFALRADENAQWQSLSELKDDGMIDVEHEGMDGVGHTTITTDDEEFDLSTMEVDVLMSGSDGSSITVLEYGNETSTQFGVVIPTTGGSANNSFDLQKKVQDSTVSYEITIVYPEALTYSDEEEEEEEGEENEEGEEEEEELYVARAGERTPKISVVGKGVVSDAKLENFGKQLSFKFTPSGRPEDNGIYTFEPQNLVSSSGKPIAAFKVAFRAPGVGAHRVYRQTRVIFDEVKEVNLLNNTNLSISGWSDTDSSPVEDSDRGNIVFVTRAVDEGTQTKIDESLNLEIVGKIASNKIKVQTTYGAALEINGKGIVLPSGTSLKMVFPYPEGYSYGAKGMIYKVYRFISDGGDGYYATDLDCVALSYGIVAAVDSFDTTKDYTSFTVLAVEKADDKKAIVSQSNGMGTVVANTQKAVNSLSESASVVYTMTPASGFQLEYVVLNGENVDLESLQESSGVYTYTLEYANEALGASNVLQVGFVSEAAVADDGTSRSSVEGAAAQAMVLKQLTVGGDNEEIGPRDSKSTKMQIIVLAAAVGAICLIGSIVTVYCVVVRPKKVQEKEEEEARIAANRERRANRNRMQAGLPPRSGAAPGAGTPTAGAPNPNMSAPNGMRPNPMGPTPGMPHPNPGGPHNPNLPPRK